MNSEPVPEDMTKWWLKQDLDKAIKQAEELAVSRRKLQEENERLRTRLAEVEGELSKCKKLAVKYSALAEMANEDNLYLLERLKEAEGLMRDAANEHRHRVTREWLERHDTWLKGVKPNG